MPHKVYGIVCAYETNLLVSSFVFSYVLIIIFTKNRDPITFDFERSIGRRNGLECIENFVIAIIVVIDENMKTLDST